MTYRPGLIMRTVSSTTMESSTVHAMRTYRRSFVNLIHPSQSLSGFDNSYGLDRNRITEAFPLSVHNTWCKYVSTHVVLSTLLNNCAVGIHGLYGARLGTFASWHGDVDTYFAKQIRRRPLLFLARVKIGVRVKQRIICRRASMGREDFRSASLRTGHTKSTSSSRFAGNRVTHMEKVDFRPSESLDLSESLDEVGLRFAVQRIN